MAGTTGMAGTATRPARTRVPAPQAIVLSGRDRALLRAVAAGRCTVGSGCGPVLLVDGLACADSIAAGRLLAAGLIVPGSESGSAALLTAAAHAALEPPVAS